MGHAPAPAPARPAAPWDDGLSAHLLQHQEHQEPKIWAGSACGASATTTASEEPAELAAAGPGTRAGAREQEAAGGGWGRRLLSAGLPVLLGGAAVLAAAALAGRRGAQRGGGAKKGGGAAAGHARRLPAHRRAGACFDSPRVVHQGLWGREVGDSEARKCVGAGGAQ